MGDDSSVSSGASSDPPYWYSDSEDSAPYVEGGDVGSDAGSYVSSAVGAGA